MAPQCFPLDACTCAHTHLQVHTPTHSHLQLRTHTHLLTHEPHTRCRAKSGDGPWSPGTSTGLGPREPREPREPRGAPGSPQQPAAGERSGSGLGNDSWVSIPRRWLRHQPPSDTRSLSPGLPGTLGSNRWSCLCGSEGSGGGRAAGLCDTDGHSKSSPFRNQEPQEHGTVRLRVRGEVSPAATAEGLGSEHTTLTQVHRVI